MNHTLELLIGLNICHFIGDYTHFSTGTMLSAKRIGKPLLPIFKHAAVHACLMGPLLVLCAHNWYWLVLFELVTHFIIDVLKGRLNGWFPKLSNPANKFHWYIFGADQFLHQLVIIIIAFSIN
jgi:hypothetical protein